MADGSSGMDSARRMSHGEQLARVARRTPELEALRFEGVSRSFHELNVSVDRLAAALRTRGVKTGDRVATLMTNRMEVVETYLAVGRLGAVCVPVNFRLVAEEVVYILMDSGATALVPPITVSCPIRTRVSIETVSGWRIVTPSNINWRALRARKIRSASASSTR